MKVTRLCLSSQPKINETKRVTVKVTPAVSSVLLKSGVVRHVSEYETSLKEMFYSLWCPSEIGI
jgi:hypothetical protein